MNDDGIPKILERKNYFDAAEEPFTEVPDTLWAHATSGRYKKYSDN